MSRRSKKQAKCFLANYKYEKDKAIATYAQDETPILQANFEARQAEDKHHRTADLDMGFRFASIPKVEYLRLQAMGITDDPQALMKYLELNPQYKTTSKCLI